MEVVDKEYLVQLVRDSDENGITQWLREQSTRFRTTEEKRYFRQELTSCDLGSNRNGKGAMHTAAARGRSACLKLLLDAQADPSYQDDAGSTPLHLAIELGRARCVYHLLRAGANPMDTNNFGKQAIQFATTNSWDAPDIKAGKEHIQQMLAGIFGNFDDLPAEQPPLQKEHQIAQPSDRGATVVLGQNIENSALCNVSGIEFESQAALDMADAKSAPPTYYNVSPDEAYAALERAEAQHKETDRQSLIQLVRRGDIHAVKAKLESMSRQQNVASAVACAEEGAQDTRVAMSALHAAAVYGHADVLNLLLQTGAAPDPPDDTGNTPLHCAVSKGSKDCVRALLDVKANIDLPNNFGRSPKDMIKQLGWHDVGWQDVQV